MFSTILLNSVVTAAAPGHAERVIDVGCGSSPYRHLLSPSVYVGVDWAPRPNADAVMIAGDVARLPVRSAAFDAVICTEVIEHVADERLLAAELARVAAPGAVLVLSSPFVHGLHEQPHDHRRLTSVGLVRVLSDAGWTVDRVDCVGGNSVVAVDSLVRSVVGIARRIAIRVGGRRSPLLRVVERVSVAAQTAMANAALANPRSALGPIDPQAPLPRLTLGYVVVAHR